MSAPLPRPPVRVMIGVAAQDQCHTVFAYCLANLVGYTVRRLPDVELRLQMQRGTMLPAQRHGLIVSALELGCTHVLFLDTDMRVPKYALESLLAHQKPVVGVNYPTRRLPIQSTATTLEGQHLLTRATDTECVEVAHLGFGCTLIELKVFDYLPRPWFQLPMTSDGLYGSEDIWFCRQMAEAKLPCFVDQALSAQVAHLGEWEYSNHQVVALEDPASGTD